MILIRTRLKNNSYPICVGCSLKDLGKGIQKFIFHLNQTPNKALIVTHPSIKNLYGSLIMKSLTHSRIKSSFAFFPEGEEHKNLKTVQFLYKKCIEAKLDRTSCIVALGGGVIGDTAGFVAATYLRGITLIHVPTTLLAMVDSSIGGKVGVDLAEAKNSIGAFYQPALVWSDLKTLKTLPRNELINGMAEVIKYGIIKDPKLFEQLEKRISKNGQLTFDFSSIVELSAKIKADVISQDEKETKGLREILNFGHTLGHAIETETGYSAYRHGEAISIGMCAAGFIAEKLRMWSASENLRLTRILKSAGLPIRLKKTLPLKNLLTLLFRDKKVLSEDLRFVLPMRIGKVTVKKIPSSLALQGIQSIQP
ncbi:MAG: 3-dehydroquinate synthase [Elusimicrobia bacterium]|nr:3-dehydroquinate synthase [Elusimicrobiota bacterium]